MHRVCALSLLTVAALVQPRVVAAQIPFTSPWSGWVQCQIDVRGSGYTHHETQTWQLNGPATTQSNVQTVQATWTVRGQGSLQLTLPDGAMETGLWRTDSAGLAAQIGFTLHADRITIQKLNAQLVAVAAIEGRDLVLRDGRLRPNRTFPRDAGEYQFPKIEPATTATHVTGSTMPVSIGLTFAPIAPGDARATASCSWNLGRAGDASAVTPPPAVPKPPPIPPNPPTNIAIP